MNKSEQVNELAAALSKTQAALNRAKESATNPFLKNSYADLGDIWDAARAPMTENGLSVAQFPTSTAEAIGLTTVLMHASGQWLEDTVYLPLSDERGKSQAQVAGSIISYLRRYGLSAVLGIVTGEDDDGNAGRDPRQQQKRPAQKQQAPAAQPPVEWDDLQPASNGHDPLQAARDSLTGKTSTLADIATAAVKSGLYDNTPHAFNAVKLYDWPESDKFEKVAEQKVSTATARTVLDWLISRKLDEQDAAAEPA